MTTTVDDLLQGKPRPITTKADESLPAALELMIRHDYSQIPVVSGDGKPAAILTADSIARALNNFNAAPRALRVSDAMHERFKTCRADIDLLDVLDDVKSSGAILVLDANDALVGIITTYDTTEHLRRRAQDIMIVQDIEESVKTYIRAAFKNDDGTTDETQLRAAIEEITPSNSAELRKPFNRAIEHHIKLGGNNAVDLKLAGQAFDQHLHRKAEAKPFENLSLGEYIDLFLHRSRWATYSKVLHIERDALRQLLHKVRDTRNDLAHFRTDELSEDKREELRFCRDWLGRQEDVITGAFAKSATAPVPGPAITPGLTVNVPKSLLAPVALDALAGPVPPLDEMAGPGDSRYGALAAWLQEQAPSTEHVSMRFAEIENLIGDKLPTSAREHRSWWANDSTRHVQSKQWLHVGWRMTTVNPLQEIVVFARNREREQAYLDFFSATIKALRDTNSFAFEATPTISSWITIAPLPDVVPRVAYLNLSFTRTRQLRVELYIDSGNQAKNKRLFDALYRQKAEIDTALGESLSWERINEKRASRVAIYYDGTITDDEAALAALRAKAVGGVVQFRQVMTEPMARACESERLVAVAGAALAAHETSA